MSRKAKQSTIKSVTYSYNGKSDDFTTFLIMLANDKYSTQAESENLNPQKAIGTNNPNKQKV